MRRIGTISAVAAACVLQFASPAQAWRGWDFWAWAEEWSGPGPFG